MLVAKGDSQEAIGCFESECIHVSLLLEADPDGNFPRVLRFTYNSKIEESSRVNQSCVTERRVETIEKLEQKPNCEIRW